MTSAMHARSSSAWCVVAEAKCSKCGALILWVTMVRDGKPGSKMPLDAVPTKDGTIERKRGNHSAIWYGRVVPRTERMMTGRALLYVSHFATCPNAEEFRRGG